MALSRLLIRDFRNIAAADLSLAADFNFLVDVNGSGKTSVLEAIYTLVLGRAFRSLQSRRVIRHKQREFVVHGRIEAGNVETRAISVGFSRKPSWRQHGAHRWERWSYGGGTGPAVADAADYAGRVYAA